MRYYFFGDIHGNADALDACLKHLEKEKPDKVFCLGDLAGWLPFGNETFARMQAAGFPTVAGNHDLLIAGLITDNPAQIDRMQATAYNAGLLFPMPGAVDYILGLPLSLQESGFTVVHHSPFSLPSGKNPVTIASFSYLDDSALRESIPAWRDYPGRIIFSGHDHVPAVFELPHGGDVKVHRPGGEKSLVVPIGENSRYWVKAGSVGGPYRDGAPLANSVLYDSDRETVTLFRIPYDTSRTCDRLASHRFCRNLPTLQKYIALLRSRPSGTDEE